MTPTKPPRSSPSKYPPVAWSAARSVTAETWLWYVIDIFLGGMMCILKDLRQQQEQGGGLERVGWRPALSEQGGGRPWEAGRRPAPMSRAPASPNEQGGGLWEQGGGLGRAGRWCRFWADGSLKQGGANGALLQLSLASSFQTPACGDAIGARSRNLRDGTEGRWWWGRGATVVGAEASRRRSSNADAVLHREKKWMTCGVRVNSAYPFFTAGCSTRPKRTQTELVSTGRPKQTKLDHFGHRNGSVRWRCPKIFQNLDVCIHILLHKYI
jgi:hypothetical protein